MCESMQIIIKLQTVRPATLLNFNHLHGIFKDYYQKENWKKIEQLVSVQYLSVAVSAAYRAYSRNLGQHAILARKSTFLWKKGTFLKTGHQKFHPHAPVPPYSIPFLTFLSVLHQNKALCKFCKRVQRSIVERNIGLEYASWHSSSLHTK